MKKKKSFRVERTNGDDILDALSMRLNQNLRTEKQIDDKKNNVYFWLFKFVLLLVYLLVVNACFELFKYFGVNLIYFFAVSLRSILSFIFTVGVTFVQSLFITYTILKHLKIFTNSSYYKRLYAKDRYMLKRKKAFFGVIEQVLQAIGIAHLVFVGIIGLILICIVTMLFTLAYNGLYMFSLLAIAIILLALCFFVFEEVRSKFFGYISKVRKQSIYLCLLLLILAIACFGYETNNYNVNSSLPKSMDTITKNVTMNISNINNVFIDSNAKFNNIEVVIDNSLGDVVKLEVEYYKTANVSYTSYFNDNDDLKIKFDGETEFQLEDYVDVFKLGVETIRTKTMYNYNMFKYPKVKVYVSIDNYNKINVEKK